MIDLTDHQTRLRLFVLCLDVDDGYLDGGTTVTSVAVTTSLVDTVPSARALSPEQTLAKEGALTPRSLKVVLVGCTSTV